MTVNIGNDICYLNAPTMEIPVENMHIMLAIEYSGDSFKELVADGGLAIPSIEDDKATALLSQLFREKHIEARLESFYLNKLVGYGECRMGGLNSSYFKRDTLNQLPLVVPCGEAEINYLWAVELKTLSMNDNVVFDAASKTQFVLDTGSSFFKGSSNVIVPLINAVTNRGQLATIIAHKDDLKNYPLMNIVLGEKNYSLKPEQYFVQINKQWVLGIQVLEGMPDKMLLVGQVFLETVYTIFDFGGDTLDQKSVFLAEPIHIPLSAVGTWENEYGSTLVIDSISSNGTFTGKYRSDTGATGVYPVMGVADPNPGSSQTISFSVSWKSEEGTPDPSWHYVSGITGALTYEDGKEVIHVTMLLQKNLSNEVPAYEATSVSPLTFHRK